MLKKLILSCLAVFVLGVSSAGAQPILNKDGSMPVVHWAVLKSSPGKMPDMMAMAAKNVAPAFVMEEGTYALYGGVDKSDTDVMRLLEIYKDDEAYELHVNSDAFHQYEAERETILEELILMEVKPYLLEVKPSGEAASVKMIRLEVNPADFDDYMAALKQEVLKTIADESGVIGMFVTAEFDNPNILHIMELYKDEAAFNEYLNTRHFKKFNRQTEHMVKSKILIENLPTTVKLTGRPS